MKKMLILVTLPILIVLASKIALSGLTSSSRISPTTAYTNNSLLIYCNGTDTSGEDIKYNYRIKLNGSEYEYDLWTQDWDFNSTLDPGLPDVGTNSALAIFYFGDTLHAILGATDGDLRGYTYNGTNIWEANSSVSQGLPVDAGGVTRPEAFVWNNKSYLIVKTSANITGWEWNGSHWINSTIGRGLAGVIGSDNVGFEAFVEEGNITGSYGLRGLYGNDGYSWNGSHWVANSSVSNGLSGCADIPIPEVIHEFSSNKYFIVMGCSLANSMVGYLWNGTHWEQNTSVLTDLGQSAVSAPESVLYGSTWHLILGNTAGGYDGYQDSVFSASSFMSTGTEYNMATVSSSLTDKTDNWTVQCRTASTYNFSAYSTESTVVISNLAPVLSVALADQTVYHSSNLSYDINCTDTDGDTITYYDNTSLFNIDSSSGLIDDNATIGEFGDYTINISCGDGTTNTTSSFVYTIQNYAPAFTEGDFIYSYSHGLNLSLQINGTDTDVDSLNYTINSTNFTINKSTGLLNRTGGLLVSTWTENVTITINDSINTTTMTILFNFTNTAPVVSTVNITPAGANGSDNLSLINTTTDADSDSITAYSFIWFIDGSQNSTFNNQSPVNNSHVSDNSIWIVSLAVYDGIVWGSYVNSSSIIIGDSSSPTITNDRLSSDAGTYDSPFTIYVNVSDASSVAWVYVQVTDPNGGSTNYSMSPGNANGTHNKTYTPGTDGTYTFTFFAADGLGNTGSLASSLTYTDDTPAGGGSGGGGGGGDTTVIIVDEFKAEDLEVPEPEKVTVRIGSVVRKEIKLTNKGAEDITVDVSISDKTDSDVKNFVTFNNISEIKGLPIASGIGLTSNVRYIIYTIDVSKDIPLGEYDLVFDIESGDVSKEVNIKLVVKESWFTFFSDFMNASIFKIDRNIMDKPVKFDLQAKHLIVTIIILALIFGGYLAFKKK